MAKDRLSVRVRTDRDGKRSLSVSIGQRSTGQQVDIDIAAVPDGTLETEVDAGRPWYPAGARGDDMLRRYAGDQDSRLSLSPVLFVGIGDQARTTAEHALLHRIAAETVWIDPDPLRRGGLPDFWQSNVWQAS